MNPINLQKHDLTLGQLIAIAGSNAIAHLKLSTLEFFRHQGDVDNVVASAGLVGSLIKMKSGDLALFAIIRDMTIDQQEGQIVEVNLDFIGEGTESANGELLDFKRGISKYPYPGDLVYATTHQDLISIFSSENKPKINIGKIYPTDDIPASLYIDSLLGRHFAILGSTGTGKSTLVALLLHKIIDSMPNGHIVMFDPHGEYPKSFGQSCNALSVENLKLPYWLMNFEEHTEIFITTEGATQEMDRDILAKCLLKARSKNNLGLNIGKITVDSPVPYLLNDLISILEVEMGRLEKSGASGNYLRLKLKIEEVSRDPRYSFMFNTNLATDTMKDLLANILRLPPKNKPITIIDISGIPSTIVDIVVSMISRLTFDFSIWSRLDGQIPILIVCEEAQRYLPHVQLGHKSPAQRNFERIAKEGRKHGVSLGIISQRPSDLSESVLSQCGTIIAMRLTSERDRDFVKNAMPEWSKGLLEVIPSLRNQECIICGEGVSIPIRVRVDYLEDVLRPTSNDPSFSLLWQSIEGEEEVLNGTLKRWRNQTAE